MLSLVLLGAFTQPTAEPVWTGTGTANFSVQFPGNPYDPEQNDVRVRFVNSDGSAEERLAYFVPELGAWRAHLVARKGGQYRPILIRNGRQSNQESDEGYVELTTPLPKGFLRIEATTRRFQWDSGKPYYPFGFNLGWQTPGISTMAEQLGKMQKAGLNWTRIWACHWDGKNPWWPQDGTPAGTKLWEPALAKWDALASAAEKHEIGWQLVLFHHGAFSTRVNPNWSHHPWNTANGGFLANPSDFFTDAEAKRRSKMWLRHAVARYGHNPHLIAWELFNEVEWVDARYDDRWPDIEAWHAEMAAYLRSLDPYGRLVTSSSAMERPDLWKALDFYQPHTYPANVTLAIGDAHVPDDKPFFFGEFGPAASGSHRAAVREGVIASLLAGHAGAAQYWFWDIVEREDFYPEFARLSKLIEWMRMTERPTLHPLVLTVRSQGVANLILSPTLGWEASRQTEFEVAPGLPVRGIDKLSSFLQGTVHAQMGSRWTFRLSAPEDGSFTVQLVGVARGGAKVTLRNDDAVQTLEWPAMEAEMERLTEMSVPVQKGTNTVVLENTGPDWARVGRISILGMGSPVITRGSRDGTTAFIHLRTADDVAAIPSVRLGGLPWPDGEVKAEWFDSETGQTQPVPLSMRQNALSEFVLPSREGILRLLQ